MHQPELPPGARLYRLWTGVGEYVCRRRRTMKAVANRPAAVRSTARASVASADALVPVQEMRSRRRPSRFSRRGPRRGTSGHRVRTDRCGSDLGSSFRTIPEQEPSMRSRPVVDLRQQQSCPAIPLGHRGRGGQSVPIAESHQDLFRCARSGGCSSAECCQLAGESPR